MNETIEFPHFVQTGDAFDVYDSSINEIVTHTIVGFYTGTKPIDDEMFTRTINHENDLTNYHQWCRFNNGWLLTNTSTLTELDLVSRMFHKDED